MGFQFNIIPSLTRFNSGRNITSTTQNRIDLNTFFETFELNNIIVALELNRKLRTCYGKVRLTKKHVFSNQITIYLSPAWCWTYLMIDPIKFSYYLYFLRKYNLRSNLYKQEYIRYICSNSHQIKLFSTGSIHVAKSNSFEQRDILIKMLQRELGKSPLINVGNLNIDEHDYVTSKRSLRMINFKTTTVNVSIDLCHVIDLRKFYKFIKQNFTDLPFYSLIYEPEVAKTVKIINNELGVTFRVFHSGKIICLGNNLTYQEDLENFIQFIISIIGQFFSIRYILFYIDKIHKCYLYKLDFRHKKYMKSVIQKRRIQFKHRNTFRQLIRLCQSYEFVTL